RHTVRTWLAEAGVPDAEADVFMGHKAEGSATGKRYIHRRPEYLQSVTDGIEALYAALAVLVKRPFKVRELVDQPQPDCANEASALANYLPSSDTRVCNFLNLERETRLELATSTLARSCYTNRAIAQSVKSRAANSMYTPLEVKARPAALSSVDLNAKPLYSN